MLQPSVLALKWRPRRFADVVGQEYVLPALIHGLNQQRLHHAYLFTGTRGVGKTSVARIIAACLNCEQGVSATPCGQCSACQAIANGNFVDLIEVDAASRTKVEDTRELLDNVQYLPTQGRYKVYLIDEVHMLSTHSFNALLKTLEEPPAYVKFLLATTDPQKLPVTVLSRCLQFHLKPLSTAALGAHLEKILQAEHVAYEQPAVRLLSEAAKGSVRDSLSLTDQAIAFCEGTLTTKGVRAMLGHVGQDYIIQLIDALSQRDAKALFHHISLIADYVVDFHSVTDELLTTLHHIAMAQFVAETAQDEPVIQRLAAQLSRESVQLYYQIALIGRRDLALAVSPRSGFEMLLLRMLAFEPVTSSNPSSDQSVPKGAANTSQPIAARPIAHPASHHLQTEWAHIVDRLQLSGLAKALASHCTVNSDDGQHVELLLCASHQSILSKKLEDRLKTALSDYLGRDVALRITVRETAGAVTPAQQRQQQRAQALDKAHVELGQDRFVQRLVEVFDAKLQPDSLKGAQ